MYWYVICFICTACNTLVRPDSLNESFLELIPKFHAMIYFLRNVLYVCVCTVCIILFKIL